MITFEQAAEEAIRDIAASAALRARAAGMTDTEVRAAAAHAEADARAQLAASSDAIRETLRRMIEQEAERRAPPIMLTNPGPVIDVKIDIDRQPGESEVDFNARICAAFERVLPPRVAVRGEIRR